MPETPTSALRVVDGMSLPGVYREVLRPGEPIEDHAGRTRVLPRFFYEIPSWEAALETQLTPQFGLWELIDVDVREAEPLRSFPRYVPCAITLLAAALQLLRTSLGTTVRIAANGGYRSPGHALSTVASPHLWGSAANIYRVGSDLLDSEERVRRVVEQARAAVPGAHVRDFGGEPGTTFDHVHLDLGYVRVTPADAAAEVAR